MEYFKIQNNKGEFLYYMTVFMKPVYSNFSAMKFEDGEWQLMFSAYAEEAKKDGWKIVKA